MIVSRGQGSCPSPSVLVSGYWSGKRDRPTPHMPSPSTPAELHAPILPETECDTSLDAVLARANSPLDLALAGSSTLRSAIQHNLVSFPSQVPFFTRRDDARRRIVQLYFLRGWSLRAICDRYRLSRVRIHAVLRQWTLRAVEAGYIRDIRPDPPGIAAVQPDLDSGAESAPAPFLTCKHDDTAAQEDPGCGDCHGGGIRNVLRQEGLNHHNRARQ